VSYLFTLSSVAESLHPKFENGGPTLTVLQGNRVNGIPMNPAGDAGPNIQTFPV